MKKLTRLDFDTNIDTFIINNFYEVNGCYRYPSYSSRVWHTLAQALHTRLLVEGTYPSLANAVSLSDKQFIAIPKIGRKACSAWKNLLDFYGLSFSMNEEMIDKYILDSVAIDASQASPLITIQSAIDYLISQGYIVTLSKISTSNQL